MNSCLTIGSPSRLPPLGPDPPHIVNKAVPPLGWRFPQRLPSVRVGISFPRTIAVRAL